MCLEKQVGCLSCFVGCGEEFGSDSELDGNSQRSMRTGVTSRVMFSKDLKMSLVVRWKINQWDVGEAGYRPEMIVIWARIVTVETAGSGQIWDIF